MWDYHDAVLYILNTFTEYTSSLIPRDNNVIADSHSTLATMFKIPLYPNNKYEFNVKHCLFVLDNVQYWNFFQYDKKIDNFLQMEEEFVSSKIDYQFYEDE